MTEQSEQELNDWCDNTAESRCPVCNQPTPIQILAGTTIWRCPLCGAIVDFERYINCGGQIEVIANEQ